VTSSGDYQKPDQSGGDVRLEEYVKSLEAKLNHLYANVATLSEMNTVGNVLAQGFNRFDDHLKILAGLPAQLAPLANLAPERPPIPEQAGQAITAVLDAMKRPNLPGIGSLGVGEANVPFIGQPRDPQLPGVAPVPAAPVPLAALLKLPGVAGGLNANNQPVVAVPDQQALGGGI
jgi:hypothetical protein